MMKLDEEALAAAFKSAPDDWNVRLSHLKIIEKAIVTYLSTTTPAEVGGLVERLRETHTCDGCGEYVGSQVTALLDEAATALTAERAAHAETKRERDDLKDEWQAEFESRVEANTALRMTKARLAEALTALEPFAEIAEWDVGDSESDSDLYRPMDGRLSVAGNIRVGHLRAARRVLEGDRE